MGKTTENKPGVYLYCFGYARRISTPDFAGPGEEAPFFTKRFGELAAVCREVDLNDYTGPDGERNMSDLDWVGPRAVEHQKAVERTMKTSPVFPAGFASIFSSMESLEKELSDQFGAVSDFLRRVDGKSEYGLKGLLDRKMAADCYMEERLASQKGELAAMSPGKRYFAERKLKREIEAGVNALARERCESFLNALTSEFDEFVERKIHAGGNSGPDAETIFNLAFLVAESDAAIFRETVSRAAEELAPKGISLNVSGPWPPYSFCRLPAGGGS